MSEPITTEELALEVGSANFSDERLNRRLRSVVGRLSVDPGSSLPRALDSAGLEAAYRFFSNHLVTPELILQPHFEATRKRSETEGSFLIVHDTTTFLYRYDGEREGLGRVKRMSPGGKQAFFAHLSLAVAADGTRRPLGVAAFKTWVRGPKSSSNEYQRWEDQIRVSSAQLRAAKTAIHVMDREADDYKMFDALLRDGHRFVARCQFNRRLETELGIEKLYDVIAGISASAEREVPLSRRKPKKNPVAEKINPSRQARVAKLSVTATTVAFKQPVPLKSRDGSSPTITINVVRVGSLRRQRAKQQSSGFCSPASRSLRPSNNSPSSTTIELAGRSRSTSRPSRAVAISKNASFKTTKASSTCSPSSHLSRTACS